jgi:hypothetical protein
MMTKSAFFYHQILEGQIQIIYLHTMTAAVFFFSIQTMPPPTLPPLIALQVSTRKSISTTQKINFNYHCPN